MLSPDLRAVFSFSTFTFLGYFLLATGSKVSAFDRLVNDLSNLLVFDWSISTSLKGAGILKIPTKPLGVVGTFINGYNPEGRASSAGRTLIKELDEEAGFILSLLKGLDGIAKTGRGPADFDPTFDPREVTKAGGFINGVRAFFSLFY